MSLRQGAVGLLFLVALRISSPAQSLTFEELAEGQIVAGQYSGITFANAVILTAGISLNEYEYPPASGVKVVYDNAPISIQFSQPIKSFRGHFTYAVALTVQAFGTSGALVDLASSSFPSNRGLSGFPGSHPNETIRVSSAAGISRITIMASAAGSSFTMDDILVQTFCDINADGTSDVVDVQHVVADALGNSGNYDLNHDGAVNVIDAQIATNAALGQGCGAQ